jgi:translation initiation factor 1
MSQDNRLVYSTEHGQIGKSMEKPKGRNKNNKNSKLKGSHPAVSNPAKRGVRIRRESKGRGGKNVCVVDGLPMDEKGLKTLLKKFKGQLGCGGAVKGQTLEIQGDHREKLLQLLEKEGYKAKLSGG